MSCHLGNSKGVQTFEGHWTKYQHLTDICQSIGQGHISKWPWVCIEMQTRWIRCLGIGEVPVHLPAPWVSLCKLKFRIHWYEGHSFVYNMWGRIRMSAWSSQLKRASYPIEYLWKWFCVSEGYHIPYSLSSTLCGYWPCHTPPCSYYVPLLYQTITSLRAGVMWPHVYILLAPIWLGVPERLMIRIEKTAS